MIDNSGNEFVRLGDNIDVSSFKRKDGVSVGGIKVDFVTEKLSDEGKLELEVNEVKKSSKLKDASKLQLLHYLFILSDGEEVSGKLRFPKERSTSSVQWDEDSKEKHRNATTEIVDIITGDAPQINRKSYCHGCSMEEFCFVGDSNER